MKNAATAAAKSLQSCPTLCDPIDSSPPRSTVPGILQARTLEWVAISFSNAWKWKVKVKSLSRLFAIQWTVAYQAPQSMGFFRQEYWSGLPLPSPEWRIVGDYFRMVPLSVSCLNQEEVLASQFDHLIGLVEAKPTEEWGPPFKDNP